MTKAGRHAAIWLTTVTLWTGVPTWAADAVGVSAVPDPAAIFDPACRDHLEAGHAAHADAGFAILAGEIAVFQEQVEQALAYRAATLEVAQRLKAAMAAGRPLSGADLDTLNRGMVGHLALRDRLYAVAELHECWLYTPLAELARAGVSRETRLAGVMLSLAAALVLYDNYLLAISIFEEDARLRKLLNERDSGYGIGRAGLAQVTLRYNSDINRARVRTAMRFVERERRKAAQAFLTHPDVAYLDLLIAQSPSYDLTRRLAPLKAVEKHARFFGAMSTDTLTHLGEEGVNLFSLVFGNVTGLVETRKGKLYRRADVAERLKRELRAGDILLEKTPFRLTDKFIPGHWGHAAIWVGGEEELQALGIWDHPVVRPYQDDIRAGRRVVEALRAGVVLNPIEHFLNIDDLAVLRGADPEPELTANTVIQALRQVGKAYDFNFDVETTDRIVCSELVYLAYAHIEWPTKKMLGRATISPDNVAEKALNGGPLRLVMMYHDGRPVNREPQEMMVRLMQNGAGRAVGECGPDGAIPC